MLEREELLLPLTDEEEVAMLSIIKLHDELNADQAADGETVNPIMVSEIRTYFCTPIYKVSFV